MIWILAVITTLGGIAPDVSITKVSTFPDQQKCEQTRRNMQECARSSDYVQNPPRFASLRRTLN